MKISNRIADSFGIILVLFSLYYATIGVMESYRYRSLFLGITLVICYLIKPISKIKYLRFIDFLFITACALITIYQYIDSYNILLRSGESTLLDLACSLFILVLVLEATRRTVGLPMVILVVFFLLYQHQSISLIMPGMLQHGGSNFEKMLDMQFTTFDGVFGIPLDVVARTVVIFIVFAALLEWVGGGKFFMKLSQSLVGAARGGPAKIAVISSALFGTLSGSAIANVVGTGSFTIPLMKKTGYRPEDAGAIEAAASSGGQIMPPIMGAAAFLMAGFLELPYSKIMLIALVPAILYFVAVYAAVHFKAIKYNLAGMTKDEMPSLKKTMAEGGVLLIPLGTIIGIMVVGYTPEFAGVASICLLLVIACLFKNIRIGISFKSFFETLARAGRSMVSVTSACAAAGIIVAIVVDTGIGARTSSILQSLAKGNIFFILFFAMLGSIILGMGVPTTAAYIVVAILIAPPLEGFGIPLVAAHYFSFYFAIKSGITPPVALAAYAAAPIANADPFKTGVKAFLIGFPTFIVPFLFCYDQSLLCIGSLAKIIFSAFSVALGIIALSSAIEGAFTVSRINSKTRILLLLLSVLMYYPTNIAFNLIGISLFTLLSIYAVFNKQKILPKN